MSDAYERLVDKALDIAGKLGSSNELLKEWLEIHDEPCRYDITDTVNLTI